MATSAAEGRGWVYEHLAQTTAPVIVDVGAGEGTYSILGRHLRLDAKWVAIEIYHPYIERYHLDQKYDEVVSGDATRIDWGRWPDQPFIVLLGDVVEHMYHHDAVRLLERLHRNATEIMVSIPIVESIQGTVDGNCYETHLHQWSFADVEALLPWTDTWKGDQIGRFWWKRH